MIVNLEKANTFEQNFDLLLNELDDDVLKQLIKDYAEQIIKLSERNEQNDRRLIIDKIREIVEESINEVHNEIN